MATPGLLRSAVENIVRNAMFYSGAGGKIDVTLRRDNGTAMLSVRDNGPGVPEEALPLLFKPFYRVDDSRGPRPAAWDWGWPSCATPCWRTEEP